MLDLQSILHLSHKTHLESKGLYWDETRLKARGKRNEVEWNNKFQANLMSNNPFEILNLKCFKWFTSLATLQDQTSFIEHKELSFFFFSFLPQEHTFEIAPVHFIDNSLWILVPPHLFFFQTRKLASFSIMKQGISFCSLRKLEKGKTSV